MVGVHGFESRRELRFFSLSHVEAGVLFSWPCISERGQSRTSDFALIRRADIGERGGGECAPFSPLSCSLDVTYVNVYALVKTSPNEMTIERIAKVWLCDPLIPLEIWKAYEIP